MIDYKKELFYYAFKYRVPLTVTIELISKCNFQCIHCYIDKSTCRDYLSYEQIISFGDQIIKMGCLYVILTGGEVFLHPDFKKIYTYFVKKGVCVSVFSNGSLINNDILNLFKLYPPRVVEITMYGFSDDTYRTVTKRRSFDAVKRNILSLVNNGINVLLKMFVLKENYCDFDLVRNFSLENSIPFKYDTRIISKTGSKVQAHQLNNDLSLKMELCKTTTVARFNELLLEYVVQTRTNKIFQCGAGRCSCWLKSDYHLRICNFIDCIEYDLNLITVSKAWHLIDNYINDSVSSKSKCYNCSYRSFCNYCPAISFVQNQKLDLSNPDDVYCKKAIYEAMNRLNKE